MANIWIHRKCARPKSEDYAGDELILPKQVDETRRRTCEICRIHNASLGVCYLHKGDEVNWTAPTHRVPPIIEGISGPPGSLEYNPTEVPDLVLPEEEVAESILSEEEPEKLIEVSIPEDIAEVITPEDLVTATPVESVSKPSDVLAKLESQIAKLQAKKDALET